jgi:2,4-dienoyl-CoA reductase-like NADH-dependent reductase (Old Yellow Enzyme family)
MNILKPLSFKTFKTVNRIMRSATCEYMAEKNGRPKRSLIELYKQLAEGKMGIIVTGYSYVMPNGKSNPGQTGIYSDDLIPAWKDVTRVVKDSHSLFLLQVVHGGRQVRKKNNPGPIWAPSAVPDSAYKTEPQEMTAAQIEEVIDAFINAGIRAEKAGFDGIQLHAAHGYLLNQFLSPYTNRRTDAFGGDQEKRTQIVIKIIKGIKEKVKEQFIISAKINGEDFVERGLTLQQAIFSAKLMKEAGLDFIEVSGGTAESNPGTIRKDIKNIDQEGYFLHHASAIRKEVGIPTAAVGGFRSLSVMEQALDSGAVAVDLISLSRPFVREPDLLIKFEKKEMERVSCVSCNRCFNPRGLQCWQIQHSGST